MVQTPTIDWRYSLWSSHTVSSFRYNGDSERSCGCDYPADVLIEIDGRFDLAPTVDRK